MGKLKLFQPLKNIKILKKSIKPFIVNFQKTLAENADPNSTQANPK